MSHWRPFLICVLLTICSGQARGDGLPNIVFLLADDLGYGDLGCYGHPYAKTPSIDQLAREGTLFRSAYMPGPFCAPSRCGMMTGRFPAMFPAPTDTAGFGTVSTVTENLRRRGYRTAHFGKWNIGDVVQDGTYGIDEVHVIKSRHGDELGKDIEVTEAAVDFIRRSSSQPFYMNVWFHSPHNPVRPHPSFVARYGDQQVRLDDFRNPHFLERWDAYEEEVGDAVGAMRQYIGELSQLDDQVGRVLAALKEAGVENNTIVLFSSDNGPASAIAGNGDPENPERTRIQKNLLGSAGALRGNKHQIYEGGIRVPWIVRWPDHVAAGKVDDSSIVSGVDLLPTFCSIAGVEVDPSDLDGEDVSDLWMGSNRQRNRDLFWEAANPRLAVRRGKWKLCWMQDGTKELYDLSVDPEESRNLSDRESVLVGELGLAIENWIQKLPEEGRIRRWHRGRSNKKTNASVKLTRANNMPFALAVVAGLLMVYWRWKRWGK